MWRKLNRQRSFGSVRICVPLCSQHQQIQEAFLIKQFVPPLLDIWVQTGWCTAVTAARVGLLSPVRVSNVLVFTPMSEQSQLSENKLCCFT